MLRGYVRKWQGDLDAEFESLQLIKNLLATARRPHESDVVPDSRGVATRPGTQQAKARAALPQSPQTSKAPLTKAPVPKPAVNKNPGPKAPLAKPAAAASGK